MFYYLFIKNHGVDCMEYHKGLEAFIIAEDKLTGEKRVELEDDGFKLIHDSLKSQEEAEKYAVEEYDAHTHCCSICSSFISTNLIQGKIFSNRQKKFIPFNGYICNVDADAYEVSGITLKEGYYVDNNKIKFPNRFTESALIDFPELKDYEQ